MCCKTSPDRCFVALLLLVSVQVLQAQPQACVDALNAADDNNDSIINKTEYKELMGTLSPYVDCPDTSDNSTAFSGLEPLSLVFEGLSCLCQQYDDNINCCSGTEKGLSVPGVYPDDYTSRLCGKLSESLVVECGSLAPTPVPTVRIIASTDSPSASPSFFEAEARSLPNDDDDTNMAKIITPVVLGCIALLLGAIFMVRSHRKKGGFDKPLTAHAKGALEDDLTNNEPTEVTADAEFTTPTRSGPRSPDPVFDCEEDIEANTPKRDDLEKNAPLEEQADNKEVHTPVKISDSEDTHSTEKVESVKEDVFSTPESSGLPHEEPEKGNNDQYSTPEKSTLQKEELEQISTAQLVTPEVREGEAEQTSEPEYGTPTLLDLQLMSEPTEEVVMSEDDIDTPITRNFRVNDPIKDLEDILDAQHSKVAEGVFRTTAPAQESLQDDSEIQFSTLAMGAIDIEMRNSGLTSESEDSSYYDITPFDSPQRGTGA